MTYRHALLVANREFLENVRTRGFWLGALAMPVIFLIMSIAPVLLAETKARATYAVLDNSGWVHDAVRRKITADDVALLWKSLQTDNVERAESPLLLELREALAVARDSDRIQGDVVDLIHTLEVENATVREPEHLFERIADWWQQEPKQVIALAPGVSFAKYSERQITGTDAATLNQQLENGELLGYFVIPDDPVASPDGAQYVTKNLTNRDLQNWFGKTVTEVVQRQRIREESINEDTAKWIQEPIAFEATVITESGEHERASINDTLSQWAPVGFVYLLWMSIFSITQMLLTNTIEEKSNKLVEVLLSSISAVELMSGKILGIAMTGLTIISVWLSAFILFLVWLPTLIGASSFDLSGLVDNPLYLVSFVVYFLLGYFFYAAVLCALGSVCSTLKEAQNMAMPVQFLLFVPLIVMIPVGRDPNGLLANVLSWIPPFTPFVMLNRAAMPPSTTTYVLTTLLMLVSIAFALRVAARVFESGILMTGKPPRLRQMLQMLRRRKTGIG